MVENKKKITLLVVGVLTLLVTVISATFAYFNMIGENTSSTADISGETGSLGTVVLETIDKNIFIDLGIDEMSSTNIGKTFYSSNDESIPYNEEITPHDILKTSVVGGDEGISYNCTYTLNIEGTGFELLNENDAFIVVDGEEIDLTELKNNNPITREIEANGITNEVGYTLTGYAYMNNREVNQNNLRGLDLSLEITASNLKCEHNLDKPYAIYSETDKSLRFYQIAKEPVVGDTYNNLEVTAVYSGFEEEVYEAATDVPWNTYATVITSVVVEDEINPISTAYWFYDFRNTSSLDVTNINTSQVTNMTSMFHYTGYNTSTFNIIGVNDWNTSNVTDMSWLFTYAGYSATNFILDLSNWDTSNVTTMQGMFGWSGYKATTWNIRDLSEWDTSKVKDMQGMFDHAGYSSTIWDIGDISLWDTSNVTTMKVMFAHSGYSAKEFNINLSGWDNKELLTIYDMFFGAGFNATTVNINLTDFGTSKVTEMVGTFHNTGYNSTSFTIIGLEKWDTSNVTSMWFMFNSAGYNATTFNIGDISSWDTSNAETMQGMFYLTGYKASYSLNLRNWNVSKVTAHDDFNGGVTSKVTAPRWVN